MAHLVWRPLCLRPWKNNIPRGWVDRQAGGLEGVSGGEVILDALQGIVCEFSSFLAI